VKRATERGGWDVGGLDDGFCVDGGRFVVRFADDWIPFIDSLRNGHHKNTKGQGCL